MEHASVRDADHEPNKVDDSVEDRKYVLLVAVMFV
jgi:hypothetical protein